MHYKILISSLFLGGVVFLSGCTPTDTEKTFLSPEEAKAIAQEIVDLQPDIGTQLGDLTEVSGVYQIPITVKGQSVTSYMTQDGKFIFSEGIEVAALKTALSQQAKAASEESEPTSTPTSAHPKVELFVMSHCPFGTQMEKAFLPVWKLLGDEADFSIEFVHYVMHGEIEIQEQLLQHCLQTQNENLYRTYLECFLAAGDTESCLAENEVDTATLETCVAETDETFGVMKNFGDRSTWLSGRYPIFDLDAENSKAYGVQGSPTLVINGEKSSANRTPESIKQAICDAFETKPATCDTPLSADGVAPGFGYDGPPSDTDASCG